MGKKLVMKNDGIEVTNGRRNSTWQAIAFLQVKIKSQKQQGILIFIFILFCSHLLLRFNSVPQCGVIVCMLHIIMILVIIFYICFQ